MNELLTCFVERLGILLFLSEFCGWSHQTPNLRAQQAREVLLFSTEDATQIAEPVSLWHLLDPVARLVRAHVASLKIKSLTSQKTIISMSGS